MKVAARVNDRGFLAKLETEPFNAESFANARMLAFRIVAPALSLWSIECNASLINIYRVQIIEQSTKSRVHECL